MVTANDAAFVALSKRMNDRTKPHIVSLPAYYRTTLENEMGRQRATSIQR
ncbi:hypothetical protein [Aneurinibacillus danicus]|nr:hypothetical protein [Aneurinibacillus danicus]